MQYQHGIVDGVPRAGWGDILVDDLPDTGRAGILKKVLKDARQSRIRFECEGHDGCPDCEYAWPLIKYGEGSQPVYLKVTTRVVEESAKATIYFDAKASSNSTYSCPDWWDDDIPVEWEVEVTTTGEGTSLNYRTKAYIRVDGGARTEVGNGWSYNAGGANYAGSQIADSITRGVKDAIKDQLREIASNPLNGVWPQITVGEVNDLVADAYIEDEISISEDSFGIIRVPVKKTNGRQGFLYGGGEAWQDRITYLKINKSVQNASNYGGGFLNLPAYNLSGTKFYVYDSPSGGSVINDKEGRPAIITISGANGGVSDPITFLSTWSGKTVYIQEELPSSAIGYEKQYHESGKRFAVTLAEAGETKTADIKNNPLQDPVSIIINKDPNLNKDRWIGKPDLEGIEYTLEYYTDKACTNLNRTWKFKTNSNGEINCRQDTPTSGTRFTRNGQTIYPVGWYKLYESTSETELQNRGLEKSPDVYYIEVHEDEHGQGVSTVYSDKFITEARNVRGNGTTDPRIYQKTNNTYGVIEKEHWEPFAFVKKDIYLSSGKPEGDTELEGAVFTVYSEDDDRFGPSSTEYDGHTYSIGSGNVVLVDDEELTITIDANGKGICEYPLPKTENATGKRFYIKETTAPLGYKANDSKYYIDYQNRITVRDYNGGTVSLSIKNMETNATENTSSIYSVADGGTVKNTPRKGSIEIEKFDDDI